MPFSHLILCRPLLLLPPIPPRIRVFSNESTLRMRWPKYWSFSFSIIPSKEIPGLISFRMDWLDLLAVQGTLKRLLQHHSSKASILQRSAFFTVQLSHPYMTTGKTIALTRRTFVGKAILLENGINVDRLEPDCLTWVQRPVQALWPWADHLADHQICASISSFFKLHCLSAWELTTSLHLGLLDQGRGDRWNYTEALKASLPRNDTGPLVFPFKC